MPTLPLLRSLTLGALMLGTACGVPQETHDAVVKDLEQTKVTLAETQQNEAALKEELAKREEAIALASDRINTLQETVNEMEKTIAMQKADLSMFKTDKGGLEAALKASKAELAELRKARAQAELRAAQYRKLTAKLANMVRAGKLSVKIRNGKMVIQLPNNVLFDQGKTELKADGQQALAEVAGIIATFDRQYLIAGHTDNVPISSGRFASNWDLSAARAVEVVSFLEKNGVPQKKLAAAGYGEFDPVASNETKEGQALNRRIEIILMPNLDELPAIPEDVLQGA